MHEHYKINEPDVVSEEMADEVVIINLETGYFSIVIKQQH